MYLMDSGELEWGAINYFLCYRLGNVTVLSQRGVGLFFVEGGVIFYNSLMCQIGINYLPSRLRFSILAIIIKLTICYGIAHVMSPEND